MKKKSGRNSVEVIRNCEYESANLIGLFWAVGRLKGIDETFWHQQQEARHVVQRLAAMNLWLCDDWPRLGRTEGGGGQDEIDVLVDKLKREKE